MILDVSDVNELPQIAEKLLTFAGSEKIFLFYGDMGAGKTTLIKALCLELGINDLVSSPTFSIVNEYPSPTGSVFHFDFYRLKNETEALDLGYEDYIYSGNYCFIEWPEKIQNLLPENSYSVYIKITGEHSRQIIAENQQSQS
jgi:tRNA threonylcarbamoyladenosine biosynthesis protein TsaE